ncbi:MAG: hypothetical protein HZA77_12910 [Candidatus Schekmanbacteria bacterium]|nr:hypothetical protein [Candidatus Schekmanbacteria bacterium]
MELKKLYGDKFIVEYDEAAKIDGKKPEYQIIKCCKRAGNFYVISSSKKIIGFWCIKNRLKKKLLKLFPEMNLLREGDDNVSILGLPSSIFLNVASVAGAKRKRVLSDNHKKKLLSTSKNYRFSRHKMPILKGQETKKGSEAYPTNGKDITSPSID